MGRIRSVKPELCRSETMAALSALVERTFVRLWTECDDEGRALDHPRLLKAALFPLHDDVTPEDIDWHLHRLAQAGLICRYEANGKRYLAVTNWAEHQHPQKPRPSLYPSPADGTPIPDPDEYATPPVALPDESSPVVGVGVVVGEVGKGSVVADQSPTALALVPDQISPPPATRGHRYPEQFETWWALYPLKVDKWDALKAWKSAVKIVGPDLLLSALHDWVAYWEADRTEKLPFPSTWLNKGRYETEPPPLSGPTTKVERNRAAIVRGAQAMAAGAPTLEERLAAAGGPLELGSGAQ